MQEIIRSLCTYVETGEATAQMKAIEEQWARIHLMAVVVRILQWLRSRFDRPLDLNSRLSGGITDAISASPDLCLVFEIDNQQVRFRNSISQEEKQEIKDFVRSRPLGRLMAD